MPFEIWRYDHFAGKGPAEVEFVDKDRNGCFSSVRISQYFNVQRQGDRQLRSSALILARQAYSVPPVPDVTGLGPDSLKVVPADKYEFTRTQFLIPYVQIYNAAIDPAKGKTDLKVSYIIRSGGRIVAQLEDTDVRTQQHRSTEGIEILGLIPVEKLEPGDYSLSVRVLDRVSGKSVESSVTFTVVKAN